jgi:hypothetical protein
MRRAAMKLYLGRRFFELQTLCQSFHSGKQLFEELISRDPELQRWHHWQSLDDIAPVFSNPIEREEFRKACFVHDHAAFFEALRSFFDDGFVTPEQIAAMTGQDPEELRSTAPPPDWFFYGKIVNKPDIGFIDKDVRGTYRPALAYSHQGRMKPISRKERSTGTHEDHHG